MKFVRLLLVACALAFGFMPPPSTAQTARGNVFEVEAKIFVDGQIVGNPQLRVAAGSEVVSALSTPRGYAIRITVDNDLSRQVAGDTVHVRGKLYFADGSNWVQVGAPDIQMLAGATARQSSSAATVYGSQGYTLELTVRRTDQVADASEIVSVENCALWQALSKDGPLEGVRLVGSAFASSAM